MTEKKTPAECKEKTFQEEGAACLLQLVPQGWRRFGLNKVGKRSWKARERQIMEELLTPLRILALVPEETGLLEVF